VHVDQSSSACKLLRSVEKAVRVDEPTGRGIPCPYQLVTLCAIGSKNSRAEEGKLARLPSRF
jgi:hypothetical protein